MLWMQELSQGRHHKDCIQTSSKGLFVAWGERALLVIVLQTSAIFYFNRVCSTDMTYLVYYCLIIAGSSFSTAGLLLWEARNFTTAGLFIYDGSWTIHPLLILILGIAMIVPAIWEIFQRGNRTSVRDE